MRVIIDTNVFVASFLGQSAAIRQIVDACFRQDVQLILSEPLLEELRATLHKPHLLQRHGLSNRQIDEFLNSLAEIADMVSGQTPVQVTSDPDDNMLFAAAVEGNADYIISGDEKHVVPIGQYMDQVVMRPNEFVELLEEKRLTETQDQAA